MKAVSIFSCFILLASCQSLPDECCVNFDEDQDQDVLGQWRLYEWGYSPGTGYIIDDVPDDPAQIMRFEVGNWFFTNIQGLENYEFYYLLPDNRDSEDIILALFENKPIHPEKLDADQLDHSYFVKFEGGNLKLYYRYCIEGCHMGLKRIDG